MKPIHSLINESAIKHYIKSHQDNPGIYQGKINGGHFNFLAGRSEGPVKHLVDHLQQKIQTEPGGSAISGGSAAIGGSLHLGGGFEKEDIPTTHQGMYQFVLHMSPYQLEMFREISAQMLGGKPSAMWGNMADSSESLEADPEEYENIIRMPNSHAAARMIEAEHGLVRGGGFMSAMKHVARKAAGIYKAGHSALKWVNRNKDLLLDLPGIRNYAEPISGMLDTATEIDNAINPIVDATIDATKENATAADRQKLKVMAEASIKKAVEEHLPKAKPYMQAAEEARDAYQELKRRNANGST